MNTRQSATLNFQVFHPNLRLFKNEVKFGMMKLQVLCGVLARIHDFYNTDFFFTSVMKIVSSHNLNHLRKNVFHILNFKVIRIGNKINLAVYF